MGHDELDDATDDLTMGNAGALRRCALMLAAAFGLAMAGCSSDPDDADGPDDGNADGAADTGEAAETDGEAAALTYWTDIKPLLDARCGDCHTPGGVTPFAIESYEDAVMYAPAASASIHAGTMPPWPPNDECADYVAPKSMAAGETELLDAWIAAGMPEGDPALEGPPMQVEKEALSRVDLTMQMEEGYTPTGSPDDYRCFVLPWPEEYDETVYVTGFRAVPGNMEVAHHVIAYLAPPEAAEEYQALDDAEPGPGYTCFGGTNGSARGSIGGWAPGNFGSDLPEGLGTPVEPGSLIVLQMHYNTIETDEPAPDRTSIELKIDTEVERAAFTLPVLDPQWVIAGTMNIPAGEKDVVHEAAFDPNLFSDWDRLTVHRTLLHMHLLGTQARLTLQKANGDEHCMLQIDDWDFDWQDFYTLREPLRWEAGDTFGIECHYDNSAENQPYVDGKRLEPRDVNWGEGTTDEMCVGFVLVTAD